MGRWPSLNLLASDLKEKPATVRKWRFRNSIPAGKWAILVKAADRRGYRISAEMLVRMAKKNEAA